MDEYLLSRVAGSSAARFKLDVSTTRTYAFCKE